MTPADTLCAVSKAFGITVADIKGPGRSRYTSAARAEAARQLYALGLSSPEVGRLLNRNHTTVLYILGRTASSRATA